MIIYIGILFWFICVHYMYINKQEKVLDTANNTIINIVCKSQVFITFGILAIVVGLRSAGADTEAYIINFNQLSQGWINLITPKNYIDETEWLFTALGILCKTINKNYHLYLLVIAAITSFLLGITIRRVSSYYTESIILFMLMGYFLWMINGMRQFLAASILFYASKYIENKDFKRYILLLLCAFFIHNSAMIMFPIYFIVQGEAWNKRTILFIILGIVSVIFLNTFLNVIEYVTNVTMYEGYLERFQEYGGGSNFLRTLIYAVTPTLAFIKRKELSKATNSHLNIAINMSIICTVISLIANFTSGILIGRLPVYFSLYNLSLIPWILHNTNFRKNHSLSYVMYICYSILFLYLSDFYYYSDILFGGRVIPRLWR